MNKLAKQIEGLTLWSFLRSLRTNRLVSSTYIWLIIVPVASKLTSGVGESLSFELGGVDHHVTLSLPFSWKIFFLSALAFSIGNALFSAFSPRFIRLYSDFGHFTRIGGTARQLEQYKDDEMRNSEYFKKRMQNLAGISGGVQNDSDKMKDLFWALHENNDSSLPIKRRFISVIYLIGFVLFLWVALSNIIWAVNEIFF